MHQRKQKTNIATVKIKHQTKANPIREKTINHIGNMIECKGLGCYCSLFSCIGSCSIISVLYPSSMDIFYLSSFAQYLNRMRNGVVEVRIIRRTNSAVMTQSRREYVW